MRPLSLIFALSLAIACNGNKGDDTGNIAGDGGSTDDGGSGDGGGGDGGGDGGSEMDADGDGFNADVDCDDTDPSVHPGAPEDCNGVDDNCNGDIDEGATRVYFLDEDGDGFGTDADTVEACSPPAGYVDRGGDCDDSDPRYHPGADESDCADPNDYNCDGSTGYDDLDGDGSPACEDCDDHDETSYPGGTEVCDDADNDCNGTIDDNATDAKSWYTDADGDGFGDEGSIVRACEEPTGATATGGDCDDTDADINPDADEECDDVDNDCDGFIDEEGGSSTLYTDADGDGFGDPDSPVSACEGASGYVSDDTDCDDSDADVNPDGSEVCNDYDDDCDGLIDDDDDSVDATVGGKVYYTDEDGDGYGLPGTGTYYCDNPGTGWARNFKDCDDEEPLAYKGATEVCDDVDNDCDGAIDWGLRVPDDYTAIADAIAASTDGDTVCVAAGTYTETIDFDGKAIEVQGVDGSASTIIDGDGDGPVVTMNSRETAASKLVGFTITGGNYATGAGVYLNNVDSTLEDIVVTGNECTSTRSNCYGAFYAEDSDFSLTDAVIYENDASGTSYGGSYAYLYGGGVYLDNSNATFQDVTVYGNTHSSSSSSYSLSYGLGVYTTNSDLVWSGGSVYGHEVGTSARYGYVYGAGIYLNGGDPELSNIVVADNVANGGYYGYGGGIYVGQNTDPVFTNLIVTGNSAEGGYYGNGGGVYLSYYIDATFVNCDIVGNTAEGSSYTSYGGGIYGYYYVDLTMVNTNIVDNEADRGGGLGTQYSAYIGSEDITYSNFYDNGSDEFEGYSDPVGSDGNIAVDPEYTDVSSTDSIDWDLQLGSKSDCVDAGDPSIEDADGSDSDIGAYGGPGGADW